MPPDEQDKSCINDLPQELIYHIFLFSLPTPRFNFDPIGVEDFPCLSPLNLSRVCRSWRDITLTSAQLWSQWCLNIPDSPTVQSKCAHFLQQCLDWSADVPLTVHLTLNGAHTINGELIDVISASQKRWSWVEITTGDPTMVYNAADLAKAKLTHAGFTGVGKLRELSDDLTFHFLNELILESCTCDFLNLLHTSPNLANLSITGTTRYHWDSTGSLGPPVRLDRLRRLRTDCAGNSLLNKLACPELQRLEVILDLSAFLGVHDSMTNWWLFLKRNQLSLDSFVLGYHFMTLDGLCRVTAADLLRILRLLPLLTSLDVALDVGDESEPSFFDSLALHSPARPGQAHVCPQLESITLRWRTNCEADLFRLIETRWRAPPRRLARIRLCCFDQFSFFSGRSTKSLPESWDVVSRCIAEGLSFDASSSPYL